MNEQNRTVGTDGVQFLPGGTAFFRHKRVVVAPAHDQGVPADFSGLRAQAVQHARQAAGVCAAVCVLAPQGVHGNMAVRVNKTGVQGFAAKIGDAGVFPGGRENFTAGSHGFYQVSGHKNGFGQRVFGIHGPYATVYQGMLLYAFHRASCAPRTRAGGTRRCESSVRACCGPGAN